ncbi:MAG: hypothetical protein H6839_15410 [Planctomycetes bacterium]|nr:hypothetical protein [Planctomycetota bacterium]
MRSVYCLITICLALMLFACSDDKPAPSSSDKCSSSKCTGKEEKSAKDDDKTEKQTPPDDEDEPWGDAPRKDDDLTVKTDNDKPSDTASTERGYKDSKQPEADSLDGKELMADTEFKAGERMKVSRLGFSYVVPAGAITYFGTGGAAIQVGEKGGDLLTLIIARTGVTEAEARDMLSQPYDTGNGQSLTPQGELTKSGDRMSRSFSSAGLSAYSDVLVGKSTGVAVLTIGPAGAESRCKAASAKVADTVKFATPGGEKDRVKYEGDLKGKVLKVFIYKSGGAGYGGTSWSSETNKHWHLGSDKSYLYFYQHTGASSFDNPDARGGHAADTNKNHEGSWSVELTLAGVVLMLRDTDGVIHTHALTLNNGRLYIDGDEATVGPSDKVR